METFYILVGILALICVLGFFNEKVTKLTYEIALMLFATIIGVVILIVVTVAGNTGIGTVLKEVQGFDIHDFLMHGVLCFMLFAGSCHLKLKDFKEQARQITVLSFVCTLLGTIFYGLLIYGAGCLLGNPFPLPVCLMFGSIIAPTDPIAATGILGKFGLPKKTSFLIQGESLFNDGVGVALFVCFSGIVGASSAASADVNVVGVMFKEILGALAIAVAVTFVCFMMFRFLKHSYLQLFISLLTVGLSYALCEALGFSGAIASVVCGILFSELRTKYADAETEEQAIQFDGFWETLDVFLNSILYVIMGLSFIVILKMESVVLLAAIAIIANLIARVGSLSLSSLILGKIPDGFTKRGFIALFTWGGLRGGLSVALAMSTKDILPEDTYFIILGCTYAVVFFTTVVQGLTMKSVYQKICKTCKAEVGEPTQSENT